MELTRGQVALVDDSDFKWLNQWKWSAALSKGKWYAKRTDRDGSYILMHRLILGVSVAGLLADHRDGDGLNNQRHNLRVATVGQNAKNRGFFRNNTTGFKGIAWEQSRAKWKAQIRCDGRNFNLGRFRTKQEAAAAYVKASVKLFGDFSREKINCFRG